MQSLVLPGSVRASPHAAGQLVPRLGFGLDGGGGWVGSLSYFLRLLLSCCDSLVCFRQLRDTICSLL